MMNIMSGRWSTCKQELLPIIVVSGLHVWWIFNYPPYTRCGAPWNVIFGVIASCVGIVGIVYAFSHAETYAPFFDAAHLDNAPGAVTLKRMQRIIMITMAHVVFFFFWYNDFWHMSTRYFLVHYIFSVVFFVLLYRAAQRQSHA